MAKIEGKYIWCHILDLFKTWKGTPVPAQIGLCHSSVGKRSVESAANLSVDTSSFLSVETEVGGGGRGRQTVIKMIVLSE